MDSVLRGDGRYPVIIDFVSKSKPRFIGKARQTVIINPLKELVPEIVSAVSELDRSVLPIQGPPGTGKTYVSSCAILDLVRRGKRVAVASNSHKAVDNLLCAVLDRAAEAGETISVAKKGGDAPTGIYSGRIHQTERNDDVQLVTASVVGGTAWLFSRIDFEASFDYLFVDEAGQVSVANIVAMATSATNIVLVGDPMQLSQPIQGAHPGESGFSALEYLLAGHNTVPADRGIFLPISRRMHPDVCRFISDIVYEGLQTPPISGNSVLTEGAGSDNFVFKSNFGKAEIKDFHPATDTIQFDNAVFRNFADVSAHTADDGHGDTVIAYDANNTITLDHVLKSALTAGDFHFI